MPKLSEHYNLGATQPRLDFVDTHTDRDLLLFVDPFAISLKDDAWSVQCLEHINSFFQRSIDLIHAGDDAEAQRILDNLKEPKETGLGYGTKPRRGRGVAGEKAISLHAALANSHAARTGLLTDLGEFDLFIDGIGPDGLSDITTNIIKRPLIEYTQQQARLWGIPLRPGVAVQRIWDIGQQSWASDHVDLPVIGNSAIILVPKFSARRQMTLSSQEFYNDFVLDYLEQEEIARGSALVHVIKSSGRVKVSKKDLKEKYRFSKNFLAQFSEATPDVLRRYKEFYQNLPGGIGALSNNEIFERFEENFDERAFSQALIEELRMIQPGNETATQYHRFMVGVIEFLFYPNLIYPILELEIHEGRKRIDIVYTNSSQIGFFKRAQSQPQLRSQFVPVECKNYSKEPANPELDQIAGRFSHQRGWLGIMCCRQLTEKDRFIQRCRDTAVDGRGVVLPLDDADIVLMLDMVVRSRRSDINDFLEARARQIQIN